jgi:hypothetical protein
MVGMLTTKYKLTQRTGTTKEYASWTAVIRAARPGAIVERRTASGWQAVTLMYGLAKRKVAGK